MGNVDPDDGMSVCETQHVALTLEHGEKELGLNLSRVQERGYLASPFLEFSSLNFFPERSSSSLCWNLNPIHAMEHATDNSSKPIRVRVFSSQALVLFVLEVQHWSDHDLIIRVCVCVLGADPAW